VWAIESKTPFEKELKEESERQTKRNEQIQKKNI
jgi:hypothetical protein